MKEDRRDHKIYKYTNKVNGKVYIGRTCTTLKKRAGSKGRGYESCWHFYNAIQKYGWENFEPEILEERLTNKEATDKELYYINYFDSSNKDKGYNIINDLRGSTCWTDEKRKSRSDRFKGKNNPMYGRILSQEERAKISERTRGENNPFFGRHHTEETKQKISENNKEYYKTHKNWAYGKKMNEETRKKLSASKKGKYCGKESPRYGKKHTEESKRKMSEHMKGRIPHNRKKVRCVETGEVFESAQKAANTFNIDNSAILKCCKKESKTCGGYHWRYADPRPSN